MSSQNIHSILSVLTESVLQVLPTLTAEQIQPHNSLRDLGANSIDRAEILMLTMAALKLRVPMVTFSQAKNIGEITAIFRDHLEAVSA